MKRFCKVVTVAALALAVCACSSGDKTSSESSTTEQAASEKSAVQRFTDETAEKIEKKIRTPIDKARATSELGDEHTEAMDKALQQSTEGQ